MNIEDYGDWTIMNYYSQTAFLMPGHQFTGWYEVDGRKVYVSSVQPLRNGYFYPSDCKEIPMRIPAIKKARKCAPRKS